ncbi:SDR family NAD(P)-dependent oxidoreductase [Pseudomonas taiwanensis]|uniref:SDR family NAD(P)-dependent oxidoreductase n=1 Tax=Pseudomonas taiwanensis TaxID=470150 RepID=UPI0016456992|nr:SDR family NAD(P)-dependent oxidoreductase [Pseudomonas taiwanensis]MBC3492452.1 SDR family oxidoreductase [Pseudomonas taiwanensis]
MFDLKGKVAVITGGETGIGLAISRNLAIAGVKTVIGGIQAEAGEKAAAEIAAEGGDVIFVKTDVRSQAQVEALVQTAVDTYGKLDIMVNNAGVFDGFADVLETTEALWDQITGINLKGTFFGCQAALKHMIPNGTGRIINTSSIGGLVGRADGASYTASKFAVIGLTRQMATSHSETGVTFNTVCPGVIATDIRGNSASILPNAAHLMNRGVGASDPEAYKKSIPARRKGTSDEVAAAVLFLASDEASYITGHSLVVDGGFVA